VIEAAAIFLVVVLIFSVTGKKDEDIEQDTIIRVCMLCGELEQKTHIHTDEEVTTDGT
jgi:hypothetical protein